MGTSTIFISHRSTDNDKAQVVYDYLVKKGFPKNRIFLDFDPESGLIQGMKWRRQLMSKLQDCACLIVVYTEDWSESSWCALEANFVSANDRPCLPLFYDPIQNDNDRFLEDYQGIHSYEGSEEQLKLLISQLKRLDLDPPTDQAKLSAGWQIRSTMDQASLRKLENSAGYQLVPSIPYFRSVLAATVVMVAVILGLLLWPKIKPTVTSVVHELKTPQTITTEQFLQQIETPAGRKKAKGQKFELCGTASNYESMAEIQLNDHTTLTIIGGQRPLEVPPFAKFSCVIDNFNPDIGHMFVNVVEFELIGEAEADCSAWISANQ